MQSSVLILKLETPIIVLDKSDGLISFNTVRIQ